MRKFVVNVDGNQYEVEVEEVGTDGNTVETSTPKASKPKSKPKPKKKAPQKSKAKPKPKSKPQPSTGSGTVAAEMPGTILDIKVSEGEEVSRGDVLLVLEAMKMENDIMAATDGVVDTIHVAEGDSVNSGDLMVTLS